MAERVRETAAKQRALGEVSTTIDETLTPLKIASRHWVVGVYLLGSGAEHINAATKQRLATALIALGSQIVDHWTTRNASIDFETAKKELLEEIGELLDQIDDSEMTDQQRRSMIDALFDGLEFDLLGGPLRRVTHYLCEHARSKVLGTTIAKATSSGKVDEVIHAVWLMDIESKKGATRFKKAMAKISGAVFFRLTIATHLLSRVYWAHWRVDDREVLLNSALVSVKSTVLAFNKGDLLRKLERKDDTKKRPNRR